MKLVDEAEAGVRTLINYLYNSSKAFQLNLLELSSVFNSRFSE